MARLACLASLALVVLVAAPVADAYAPGRVVVRHVHLASAIYYARHRSGVESFAVIDGTGVMHGFRARAVVPSASVIKAMFLVAYLNQASVRGRPLGTRDRALLAPMIRWSDNFSATSVRNIVGAAAIYRVATRARMRDFRLRFPWGMSDITAADQARFFLRIDLLVPARHRRYARALLAGVVPSQRWGIPRVTAANWRVLFKGGWGSGTGAVTHQVALLERVGGMGRERIAIAILTRYNPTHSYGTATVAGIAGRLLRAAH